MEESISVGAGKVIFKEGKTCESAYLIKEGRVQSVRYKDGGRLVPLGVFTNKDFLGLDSVFLKGVFTESAIAIDNCILVKISSENITQYINSAPDWIGHLFKILGERVKDSSAVLVEQNIKQEVENSGDWSDELEVTYKNILSF